MTGVLCDKNIPDRFKSKVYRTVVRSVALYGAECWPATKEAKRRLSVMETKMLRWTAGFTRAERIRNEKIRERFGIAPIAVKLRETRLRCYDHVLRANEDTICKAKIVRYDFESNRRAHRYAAKTLRRVCKRALRSIERADDAALREVLSKNSFDVNAKLNCGQYAEYSMWWTLLDVALNLRLVQCARTLQNFGAHENILMDSIEKRKDALDFALKHTYDQVLQLKLRGQDKENDRVYQAWSTHLHMLERMERALAIIQLPDPPDTVKVESHSSTSISIHIETKREHAEPVLKYLIEWSLFSDFSKIAGTYVEKDVKKSDIIISGLKSKTSLCFRVYAGGVFGYSSATIAQPSLVELSSWHDIDGEKEDWNEYVESMATISEEIDRHRQSPVWKRVFPNSDDNIKKKKSGLKEMFLASKRFSRNATKGLFLGSVLYTEGKVLFTIDDCIPLLLGLTLRWLSFDKVLRKKADSASISAALVRERMEQVWEEQLYLWGMLAK
ncbi:hypothetical protein ANCCEY_05967 [Ancylostoma ceylanicum]|uniref:Fibronectin type-III domain-containing protein n=1 Tax=Ancylostoma ceylanicum TaxID=53326 RepID=A0A0D6LSB3_9BILA|nr:hypothetical protein ANCCEY_05967 [Ancylostoma ceylanicum]